MPTPPVEERPPQFSLEAFADGLLLRVSREKRDLVNTAVADGAILSLFANIRPRLGISLLLLHRDGTTLEVARFGPKAPDAA